MSRIADAFATCRAEGRAAFVAFLTASYPDDARFLEAATAVLRHADVLEVGLPFSDPLATAPSSSARAKPPSQVARARSGR